MQKEKRKNMKRQRRHRRVRARVSGRVTRPRLSVFRSSRFLYAQLIDDEGGQTLVSVSSKEVSGKNLRARARAAGKELAKRAAAKKISAVAFDRGGYLYTGRVKEFAEGAREGGLRF